MILFWVAMLILSFVVPSHAFSPSLQVTARQDIYSDEHLESSIGSVIKAIDTDTGIFLYGGYSAPD